MKLVKKNIEGFTAFIESRKTKLKKRLKSREQVERELEAAEKEQIEKGIENIKNNIANDTNKLCN